MVSISLSNSFESRPSRSCCSWVKSSGVSVVGINFQIPSLYGSSVNSEPKSRSVVLFSPLKDTVPDFVSLFSFVIVDLFISTSIDSYSL